MGEGEDVKPKLERSGGQRRGQRWQRRRNTPAKKEFKAPTPGLEHMIFRQGGAADAAEYEEVRKALAKHAGTTFKAGSFTTDTIVVVRFQGPRANGMPELHGLTPALSVLQDRGLRVALVTDGRMSGASGKVPAAIHISPEAAMGGPLARLRDGDLVRLDATAGTQDLLTQDLTDQPAV